MKSTLNHWLLIPLLLACLFLSGCEDPVRVEAVNTIAESEQRFDQLRSALNDGKMRNAALVKQYVRDLKKQKPEMDQIANILAKDATTDGALFKHLQTRLAKVQTMRDKQSEPKKLLNEANALFNALAVPTFNSALADTVNVLADMSDGKLPRVGSMSKAEEAITNDAKDFGAGSQLVGNPAYGQWSQSSGGLSVWEWVGMYALMSHFSNNRIGYNDWDRHRPYSRYQDRGVYEYGSEKSRKQASNYQKSNTKTYRSSSQKGSTYSKGSGVKPRSSLGNVSPQKSSSYGSGSKSSSYGSGNKSSSSSSSSRSSSYGSGTRSSSYGGSLRGSSSRSYGGGGK